MASEALLAACMAGDVGGAAAALAAGATRTQALTGGGSNALHLAGFQGHAALCEFLLARGADVNAARKDGSTAAAGCGKGPRGGDRTAD